MVNLRDGGWVGGETKRSSISGKGQLYADFIASVPLCTPPSPRQARAFPPGLKRNQGKKTVISTAAFHHI